MFRSLRIAIVLVVLTGTLIAGTSGTLAAASVVTNCGSDAQLRNKVTAGGTITFNCGTHTIVLASTIFIGKDTAIDGGGKITLSGGNGVRLFVVVPNVATTLKRLVLTRGFADGDGGAIDNFGHLTLDQVKITRSVTTDAHSGGAIFTNAAPVIIKNSTLDANQAGNGGAIMAKGSGATVTMTDSTVSGNHAVKTSACFGCGGGVLLASGAGLTATRTRFVNNTAYTGGAIFSQFANTQITLTDSIVSGNEAKVLILGPHEIAAGVAGGIGNAHGQLTLRRVTVSDNTAGTAGGIGSGGPTTLENVTVVLNEAKSYCSSCEAYDAGLQLGDSSHPTITLQNVTIADNKAPVGATAGLAWYSPITVGNSLLSFNQHRNCNGNPGLTSHFNLSDDGSCGFGAGRDGVGTLYLGGPDTNGGVVPTIRLQPGSAAIDEGTSTNCPSTDARQVHRPAGTACDVGAFEFRPCGATPAAPTNPVPADGASVAAPAPKLLDWIGPDCARGFNVNVYRVTASGLSQIGSWGTTGTSLPFGSIPAGTYRWRVSSCKGSTCTPGPLWTFHVTN